MPRWYKILFILWNKTEYGRWVRLEMSIKAVLFDLDGTLLPMDYDGFIKLYFGALAKKLAEHGYEPEQLVKDIWAGTAAMVKNDGSCTNDVRFWSTMEAIYGKRVWEDQEHFEAFYRDNFVVAKEACGFDPLAGQVVESLKQRGIPVVLATNPIFPMIATKQRIEWAGLKVEDFELCTTYENIGYSKPNPMYYKEIAKRIGVEPSECLMVGNDVSEDMVAKNVGMQVFLLTDCLLNKKKEDISGYSQGGFRELMNYLEAL